MAKAAELLRTLMSRPESADDGVLANDLLREFHRGIPVELLRPLLGSPNEKVVKAGAFIASELGSKAAPLLDALIQLLHYADARVRSDTIISMMTCTTEKDQGAIASVIAMLDDPDWRIRHEVMEFLSRVSLEQLRAGLRHFESNQPASGHGAALRWLTSDEATRPDRIVSRLQSSNALERKYAVAAASRIAPLNDKPLLSASTVDDDEVKQFARHMLQIRPGNR